MSALTNTVITASYAMAAGALGFGLQAIVGLGAGESWIAAGGFLLACSQVHGVFLRMADRAQIDDEFEHLRRANALVSQELEATRRRIDHLDSAFETKTKARNEQIVSEMRVLETLIQQLADGVAQSGNRTDADDDYAPETDTPQAEDTAPAHRSGFESVVDPAMLEVIRSSLEQNRVDLYLQPIVSLPQRKVRFFEGLSRLRAEDGQVIMPAQYLRVAEAAGLMSIIDNLLLFRCVQIVRRLAKKNRNTGLICNISRHSLEDATFFPQFLEFMEHNQDLGNQLVFEFGQETFESCGPLEMANLRRLASLGFSFSLDKVVSLDLDPRYLRDRNFRFVKIPATLLLGEAESTGTPSVHRQDLKEHLARYGIDLIAERIEDERTVVEVLEFDVDYGQGFLFGEPRPIRDSALGELGEGLNAPDRAA